MTGCESAGFDESSGVGECRRLIFFALGASALSSSANRLLGVRWADKCAALFFLRLARSSFRISFLDMRGRERQCEVLEPSSTLDKIKLVYELPSVG